MAIQWNVDGMILVNIWCHQKWLEHPRITNWRLRLLKTSSIEMGELSSKTIEIISGGFLGGSSDESLSGLLQIPSTTGFG